MTYIQRGNLQVDSLLDRFVEQELLPASQLDAPRFWAGFEAALDQLVPQNQALLERREALQAELDSWLADRRGQKINPAETEAFLRKIGYLVTEGPDFTISTEKVDAEIASIAGPQLVVPIMNARYALNAANARWGSLYDALYGTDVITDTDGAGAGSGYNPLRGQKVIDRGRAILDAFAPLDGASWSEVTGFELSDGALMVQTGQGRCPLKHPAGFKGWSGPDTAPQAILLTRHNLHIEIQIDAGGFVGKDDPAHIQDLLVESAISVIMDCEDSVAAVDAEDKVLAYRNWRGLMRGDLAEELEKNGRTITRKLHPDRCYVGPDGDFTLPGRALMLVRNVGHLMTNPAILLSDGSEIPEGIMDAFMTVLGALPDLERRANSRCGSVYIVKPKMHGPDEVGFAVQIFAAVEALLGLPTATIKIGIMDEERRTSANLKESIRAAADRVVFINTGFLDRTGDEMHTAMEAGVMIRKGDMKQSAWITAYEDRNVDIGLACGFSGRAQIGKGMWAAPDRMADMLEQKIGHPQSGANCAWVPSPTAATLHALHYHQVDVFARQQELSGKSRGSLADLLTMPLAGQANWSEEEVRAELENNAQGILGYVVRWIDQGVGCSKVPDMNNIGLMEDRATLRISSQHMANWLYHGICSEEQVRAVMEKMARIVDQQNAGDPAYQPMADDFASSIAFQAACDLVFEGRQQPSGYTEPILHQRRLEKKATGSGQADAL
ncbi:MAG: malate synthase G [Alphaproteobacteria bacterium]|nr:malate synthase G [Alphaproteobacteria bacterium]